MPLPLSFRARAAAFARRLARDEAGATAAVVGLSLSALLGFAALGLDIGEWYLLRRNAQNAADSAAFSAAAAKMGGAGDVADQAKAVAANYGLVNGSAGVSVAVNTPPASGAYAGDAGAVEVIVERPRPSRLSQLFLRTAGVIRARAVGRVGTPGDACAIALHATAEASALETGSANVRLSGCSLAVNSSSSTAFQLKGAASVTASSVYVVGGYSVSNNATLTTTNGVKTGQTPVVDPYQDVPIPPYSGCTYNAVSLSSGTYSSDPASPTVFCNGLTLNSGATVTLNPGVYIIDRGDLQVNGGATLRGIGVTIVLTSSTGSNYATLHINGNSVVELTAPTSGPTQGMVFYQDRRAPSTGANVFNGGSTQSLTGALYFPNQTVTFNGGASTAATGCTQLLAGSIAFQGDSTLALNCSGTGVRMAGGAATRLVE